MSKTKVLVVEDEELLLTVIERKLKETDMDVVCCKSGEEALKVIAEDKMQPDIIWLDYHLRGMDGLEFIQNLKKDGKFPDTPILVVSNSANDTTVTKLIEAGASKYLLKAQNRLEDIISIISELKK